jgi:hypothetical protein
LRVERGRLIVATLLAIVVSAMLAAYASAAAPAIEKLLPAKGDVTGFDIMPKSLMYGKGADVSKIYDGGYEVYTKNGVIDVAKQMYQRGNQYAEVTVHTMKSPKAALDFVKYWAKQREAKAVASKLGTGFTVTKPSVMAYYAMGKYFVTVSAFYPANKSMADTAAFAAAVKKRM